MCTVCSWQVSRTTEEIWLCTFNSEKLKIRKSVAKKKIQEKFDAHLCGIRNIGIRNDIRRMTFH